MPESSKPRVPCHNLELIIIIVTSRVSTISGVAGPGCARDEDTSIAGLVMVREAPTAAAPNAESGSGARTPTPWVTYDTRSWGPLPLEPWDAGIVSGFNALQHMSKGQET
jgi:hypothetical protein